MRKGVEMNQYQKDQLITTLEQLRHCHESYHSQRSADIDYYQILSSWQQAAIGLGTRIEMLEGENTLPVRILEEYCEVLYQYSLKIQETNEYTTQMKEHMNDILLKAEKEILNIETKIEIVFLPYNASMWDSLESIWKAAYSDLECSCRVIPIPYFDKDSEGNFISMHYEGDDIPKYVPIIHYDEYDITENKPDVIYIHNPYDNYNFVTSVHPSYYSSELKKHTKLLVYVPYFILGDTLPSHLAEAIGVFHADRVITQSESINTAYKKSYIEVLGGEEKEKEKKSGIVNQRYWDTLDKITEDKFLPLGSPKIDKVIYHIQHRPDVPKEWSDIICKRTKRHPKEDISDIKLILYNTAITDLLTYKNVAINKLKSVLNEFKDRTDAILIWRPHPLNVNTIKSMTPHLLEKYLNLVEEFCQEKYGIYDDSADLHRAIALADAYYGDAHSSLVELFGVTGKPIMFQNMDITDYPSVEEMYSIGFEDFVEDGDYIWFSAIDMNGLFRMNMITQETEFIGHFPNEPKDGKRLYFACTRKDNLIIFAPFKAKNGVIYDTLTGQFISLIVHDHSLLDNDLEKFSGIVTYKNKIFLLPCLYPAIVGYSLKNKSIKHYNDWVETLSKACEVSKDAYARSYMIREDRYILIPLCNANAVLEFDMEEEKSKIYVVGKEGDSYSGICYDGQYYWLSPRHDGSIIKWDKNNNEITRINQFPMGYEKCKYSFIDTIFINEYVWMFPLLGDMIIKINPNNNSIDKVLELQLGHDTISKNKTKLHMVKTIDNKIIACKSKGNEIIIYNPDNGEIMKCFAMLPKYMQDRKTMIDYSPSSNETGLKKQQFIENLNLTLPSYIKYCNLSQVQGYHEGELLQYTAIFNSDNTVGRNIHNTITKSLK